MTELEKRRKLALQMAMEHLLSLRQIVDAASGGLQNRLLGHFCGLHDALDRAAGNGESGLGVGGVCCACHGGGFPNGKRQYKSDCDRCHGTGTVPIAEIRARAGL